MLARTPETIAGLVRHDIPGYRLIKHRCILSTNATHVYYTLWDTVGGKQVSGRNIPECIDAMNGD